MEEFLPQTIESILIQTYRDFELILINDGSTDKSLELINFYNEKDNRIKVISQKNNGVGFARNVGLEIANGKYIFFIDSDDWILENTLETIYEKLRIKDYDYLSFAANPFISASYEKKESKDIIDRYTKYYERKYLIEQEYSSEEYQLKMFENNNYVGSGCLYVFKRKLANEKKLRFLNGIFHEDNLFTRELLSHSSNVYFIPEKLYQRRIRPDSRVNSKGYFTSPQSYLIISEQLFDLSNKKGNDMYLLKGSKYYFEKALSLIKEKYNDSKEFKHRLFKLYSKLQLKEYKYEILQLKYPVYASLFFFLLKVKNRFSLKI